MLLAKGLETSRDCRDRPSCVIILILRVMKLKLREASGHPVRLVCLHAAVRRDPGVSLRWVPGWRTLRAGSGGPRGALSPWHPWLPANGGASHACAVRQRGAGRGAAGFSCASLQSRGSKISTATFSLFQKRKRDVDFLLHRVCLPVFFPVSLYFPSSLVGT